MVVVTWLAACGPEANDESPEDPTWMTGIWSAVLMTEENSGATFDGGFDRDPGHPTWYEIFEDGTYETFELVGPGEYGTFASTWEWVAEDEIIAKLPEPSEAVLGVRWQPSTGERGCDAIVATTLGKTTEGEPRNLYRGAICSRQPQPCPNGAIPGDSCFYWYYSWCEHQGTNEPWREFGHNKYCHLPGYDEEED